MSERSPELEAVARRWIEATGRGEGRTLRNLLSGRQDALYCGTSADELITGAPLKDGLANHISEIGSVETHVREMHSHATDTTGWVMAISESITPAGKPLLWRLSLYFILEDGIWKAHHAHGSYASDFHETVFGITHSAFAELLASVEAGDLQLTDTGSATVMFTDIVDSSALAEAVGDVRWARTVSDHIKLVTGVLEHHGGRLTKTMGDGTMSTFSSAGQALKAAIDIQRQVAETAEEPRLTLRVGLNTGDIVQAGDDFLGTVVNKAARVAAMALPGEIRVSEATRAMVGGATGFAFDAPVRTVLKGLEGEHALYRLEWQK